MNVRTAVWASLALGFVAIASSCGGSGPTGHGGGKHDAGRSSGVGAGGASAGGSGSYSGSADAKLAKCGGSIFRSDGSLDAVEYEQQARLWTKEAMDCRLGPRYSDVHGAGEPDTRPDLWEPTTTHCGGDGTMADHEYGTGCASNCSSGNDFGSTEGPVLYAPDSSTDPGVDRVINYAYDGVQVSVKPQAATGGSHPDPSLANSHWPTLGFAEKHAFAVGRTHVGWGNQAIGLFDDGFIGALGTRTDGVPSGNQFGFKFPKNLAPTAVAVTSMNEFVLVSLWDTTEHTGKLAVRLRKANAITLGTILGELT